MNLIIKGVDVDDMRDCHWERKLMCSRGCGLVAVGGAEVG